MPTVHVRDAEAGPPEGCERLRGADFERLFTEFRRSVFRLETLQVYRGSGEDEWIAAFHSGARTPPPDPAQDAWEEMIRANRARFGSIERAVHIVEHLEDADPQHVGRRAELGFADSRQRLGPGMPVAGRNALVASALAARRGKSVVNGRPTALHPWKRQGYDRLPNARRDFHSRG